MLYPTATAASIGSSEQNRQPSSIEVVALASLEARAPVSVLVVCHQT